METIEVRVIAYGSQEYAQACELRQRVLREPLGMALRAEDTAGEDAQLHVAAFSGSCLVGCLIAVIASGDADGAGPSVQLRQIAVDPGSQGAGIGTRLMGFVEQELYARGVRHLWLHARADVTRFYSRLGYCDEGAGFVELGIPHQKMVKRIEPPAA